MLNKLRERAQGESGFTLIELLVVMLIIGLLAAIAIPSFFNQRDKANDADAKEQVRTAQTAMETHQADAGGTYTGGTTARLREIESTLTNANLTATPTQGGDGYTVSVVADGTNTTFNITRTANGGLTYTCSAPGEGGCSEDSNGDGVWD